MAGDHDEIITRAVVQRPQAGNLFSASDLVASLVDDAPEWTDVWTKVSLRFYEL